MGSRERSVISAAFLSCLLIFTAIIPTLLASDAKVCVVEVNSEYWPVGPPYSSSYFASRMSDNPTSPVILANRSISLTIFSDFLDRSTKESEYASIPAFSSLSFDSFSGNCIEECDTSCRIFSPISLNIRSTSLVFRAFLETSFTLGMEVSDPISWLGSLATPSIILARRGCNCCHSKLSKSFPSAVRKTRNSSPWPMTGCSHNLLKYRCKSALRYSIKSASGRPFVAASSVPFSGRGKMKYPR
mmetsp:Transcript_4521/g.8987  ORF Transcript_4521/g.8987 Transcript_4521/m.8987 type:complete len:244 (+) Transcript_4521:514-1245(+)